MDYNRVTNWKKRQELIKLLDLSSPPKNLYFAGKWNPLLFNRCAAIVGSRKMTSYGERVIEKLVPRLLAQNYTIVSGFMYGVDQYAHKVCVENGGLAIAVLGWGITTSLFGDDLKLAKQIIAKGGLLLSEWEEQKAALWTFPQRNRIVAALSDKTYVVEAALQSGSLITARIAAKLKRELWAVPGPITSRTSCGTNKLIADKKAKIWLGEDLASPRTVRFGASQGPTLDPKDPILALLQNEVLTADELYLKLNLPVSEIGAKLSVFLLKGQIKEKEGKYFIENAS
jgi:DNA processing protein